jgi:hypothetical protein
MERQDPTPAAVCQASRPHQAIRLGEWLVLRGAITRQQLFHALNESHANNWRLGDAIVALGFAEPALVEAENEILEYRLRGWPGSA